MELHGYFRSSASYRVRIALNLKGLSYQYHAVNLLKGEQKESKHRQLNPQGLVPALVDDGHVLTQSLAILEWLDEQHPTPALLPAPPLARARVRALAYNVACDIQPIQNLRVLKYLQTELGASDEQKVQWVRHWIGLGFEAMETQLAMHKGKEHAPFAGGDTPGLFECCLIPQIYNAERFGVTVSDYPAITTIADACAALPAFQQARPENQPDSTL
ncbi:maleylacetoacetate isomerase [Microbulbifer agarilyticus]